MKYAIPKDYSSNGTDIRYENPVSIPNPLPTWAADASAFLAKMFPGYTGWVIVPDSTGEIPPPAKQPALLSATAFQDVCEAGLGGGSTGRARFGAVLRSMAANIDDEVLGIFKRYEKSATFDKPKSSAMLTLLVSKGVANLTAQERAAILAAWPDA